MDCADNIQPVTSSKNIIGALTCQVKINNCLAECVLDTGSGLSLISSKFVKRHHIKKIKWEGPLVTVVTGDTFRIPQASQVDIEILGLKLRGSCGIIDGFPHDLLLGVDFLQKTPFLLDFKNFILINPESTALLTTSLYSIQRTISCSDLSTTIFPNEEEFEKGQILGSSGRNSLSDLQGNRVSLSKQKNIEITADENCVSFLKWLEKRAEVKKKVFLTNSNHAGFANVLLDSHDGKLMEDETGNGLQDMIGLDILFADIHTEKVEEETFIDFEGIDEGDALNEKEEMWFPATNSLEKVWPLEMVDDSVWQALNCPLVGDQKTELLDLLKSFSEVFPTQGGRLGKCTIEQHFIDTGSSRPIKQQGRRYSRWQQDEIMQQVDELIKMDVIAPCQSEWASNPVVTFKKDKTARVCIDYRD